MSKVYTIFAGVNGAGKSTFYKEYEKFFSNGYRVNSDEILKNNGDDWRNPAAQASAMKEAVRKINYYFENGCTFNQETTLTGNSIVNNIRKAKLLGYTVNMYYVGLDNADIAVKRVHQRVKKGGHGIAEKDVRRRYDQSLRNLEKVITLCDKIEIFDNTHNFERVAVYQQGNPILVDRRCRWVKKLIDLHQKPSKVDVLDYER